MARPKYDLAGRRFSRLVAKRYLGKGRWECDCDCGGKAIVNGWNLRKGKVVSCGCYRSERQHELHADRAGKRYGRLTAIKRIYGQTWRCRCDCGNIVLVDGRNLDSGHTRSCGCYKAEQSVICNTTHGESKTRLYGIWCDMKKRCHNKNSRAYKDYGGRGIRVCSEWLVWENFRDWAFENGYSDIDEDARLQLSIERVDVNGNYEPSNCCWIPRNEQSRNRRCTRPVVQVDKQGIEVARFPSIAEASRITGCKAGSIGRVAAGKGRTAGGYIWRYAECQ